MDTMSQSYWKLIALLMISCGLITLGNIYFFGVEEEAVRILIRWSAKISAIFFAVAFGISSFHSLSNDKYSQKILKIRPHLGLSFTVLHTYHLLFLIWLQSAIHPVFSLAKTTSLIGGGMAYLFMYLMAISTFPGIKEKIEFRSWKILHTIGGYWIWFIFFRSYFRNVINKDQYYFHFGLFLLVFGLRIIHLIKKKQPLKSNGFT